MVPGFILPIPIPKSRRRQMLLGGVLSVSRCGSQASLPKWSISQTPSFFRLSLWMIGLLSATL